MKFDARLLLIITSVLTLMLLFAGDALPTLFVLLASEMGAILCGVGIWLVYREWRTGGFTPFRLLAVACFGLLAMRFISSGLVLLQAG